MWNLGIESCSQPATTWPSNHKQKDERFHISSTLHTPSLNKQGGGSLTIDPLAASKSLVQRLIGVPQVFCC